MAFGNSTAWHRNTLPKPEFLSYALTTPVIDNGVLNATSIPADTSGPYTGRRYLLQGTILSKTADNLQLERYTGANGQVIVGILYDTVEVLDNTDKSDTPCAYVRDGVHFDKAKIVDYSTYETALKAALKTCEFV